MEGQDERKKASGIKEIAAGLMYSFDYGGIEYYVNTFPDSGTIRLMGGSTVQGFDNVEQKSIVAFCRDTLKDEDLHLRALDRMGNKVDKDGLLGDLKAHKKEVGKILTNRLIRFVEGSSCTSPELLRKLKLQVGLPNYDVLKRLHFEKETPEFKKSLDVFYQFSAIMKDQGKNKS